MFLANSTPGGAIRFQRICVIDSRVILLPGGMGRRGWLLEISGHNDTQVKPKIQAGDQAPGVDTPGDVNEVL